MLMIVNDNANFDQALNYLVIFKVRMFL